MSIYIKLNTARSQFHTLKLKKSGFNKFAGYDYFELADFLIPAMEVLSKNDLCAFISFGKELATMKIVDATDGTFIEITSPMSTAALKGCHEVQQLGAVQSYLRRYLWVAALEIVEHDALDSSKPLDTKEVKRVGGLTDIGNDLPEADKQFAQEAAAYVKGLVAHGKTDSAMAYLAENNVEGDLSLYMQRFMDTPTKKALGMVFVKAA